MNNTVNNEDTVVNCLNLRELPLGLDDFAAIRRDHKIYVDKTALIFKLLSSASSYVFLARPRRFGKSLLISTFESLFKYGLRDFKGLAIEKLWHDKTYPVVHLDFSGCKTDNIDEFKKIYVEMVEKAFALAGFPLPPANEQKETISGRVEFFVKSLENVQFVLLIDEYDAPLNNFLHKPELFEKVRTELGFFYSMLKRISGKLRFYFFTGICKYKNLSIFSDTNHVTDISLDATYGTLLGYTDDEVREYFLPFVENASRVLDISVEECFKKIKESYDGFCFDDEASTHVHAPWSVLSFLNAPEKGFRNYWYTSGGQPSLLLNYIAEHALRDIREYGKEQFTTLNELDSSREVNNLNDYALLYQTGYLTIIETSGSGDVVLNYPNTEVASSMAQLYAEMLFKGHSPYATIRMDAHKLFATQPIDEIAQKLNEVLTCIDYNRFPIVDEASLEAFLAVYASGGGIKARVQVHNSYGRSDLEFAAGNRYFVFELKVVADEKKAPAKLEEAVKQIKEKHYGEGHAQDRELIRIGLVYSLEDKSFVAFKTV